MTLTRTQLARLAHRCGTSVYNIRDYVDGRRTPAPWIAREIANTQRIAKNDRERGR
jgi:hypothetical protein